MPRDYRTSWGRSRQERTFIASNILPFLSGLSVGLLVAFIVFLRYQLLDTGVTDGARRPAENGQVQNEETPREIRFTFYDTLRNKKVNISEWMADDGNDRDERHDDQAAPKDEAERQEHRVQPTENVRQAESAAEDGASYILQVGSFKEFSSADQVRAELALLGIVSDIQRVMLNEKDVRHRVRIGPYKNTEEMQNVRLMLRDNGIEFLVLELRARQDKT